MLFSSSLSSVFLPLLLVLAGQLVSAESSHQALRRTSSRRHHSLALKQRALPSMGGWTSAGCTDDSGSQRALTGYYQDLGQQATVERGLIICQKKGYKLASLQYGSELFCSNGPDKFGSALSADRCNFACKGNPSQMCGGNYASTSFSLAPASSPIPSGWAAFGLTADSGTRALQGYSFEDDAMTPTLCINTCQKKGFSIAAAEYGRECRCGATFDNGQGMIVAPDYTSPCAGDSSQACGGSYIGSTYLLVDASAASSPTTTTATSTTATSTSTSTSTSSPTSSAKLPSGWQALGCSQDGPARALTGFSTDLGNSATIPACLNFCASKGFGLAGVQYGSQCSCDSAYRNNLGASVSNDQCNYACPGDSSTKCGGNYINSVFQNAALIAGIPSGWSAVGCSTDGSARALTGFNVNLGSTATIAGCITVCAGKGFGLAGIQYGNECYCDSTLRNGLGSIVSDDQCSSPCTGDASTRCGGSYLNSLYSNPSVTSPASSTTTSSSAVASPSASLPAGWSSAGCSQDGPARALTAFFSDLGSTATIPGCINLCASKGYGLAGIQYGSQCYCDSALRNSLGGKVSDDQCSSPCAGDSSTRCGGSYLNSLFSNPAVTSPVTSVSSTSSAPAASPTSGGTWSYFGCTKDSTSTGWSSGDTGGFTQEACEAAALQRGLPIAALQYGGQCRAYRSQADLGQKVDDNQCLMACTANSAQFCGASYLSTTFVYSGSVSASPSAPTTTTTSVAAPIQSWISSGCASDYPYSPMGGRTLTGSFTKDPAMTNQMCWSICKQGGFTIAGTQNYNECWCGNILNNGNGAAAASGDCNQPCVGDSKQSCGGGWRLSIYRSPDRPQWKLAQLAAGNSFFDNWWWYDGPDPTNGYVDYQSRNNAYNNGLAYVASTGNAIMKVETTPVLSTSVRGRKSVRISTNWKFNANSLLLMDAVHMPVGCGVWPAWWTLGGGNWPYTGEIDILEGISFFDKNQGSVHTGSGCTIPTLFGGTGALNNPNCAAYETGNQGCGIVQTDGTANYGVRFNQNQGGVYAMSWTDEAISIYFFPRSQIPSDIASGNPDPDSGKWPQPFARYPSNSCKLSGFFKDHAGIFDTTFCGDWAGTNWKTNNNYAGQPATCASLTGVDTCSEYIRTRGGDLTEAYWEVKSVKLYQR